MKTEISHEFKLYIRVFISLVLNSKNTNIKMINSATD